MEWNLDRRGSCFNFYSVVHVKMNKIKRKQPKHLTQLPGSTWAITSLFNPLKYKTRLLNYKKFQKNLKKQGVKLLTVECTFKEQKFCLTQEDADIIVQRKASSTIWQKERLLNIGLNHLPSDCDKVIFLDCDIVFENESWLKETEHLLNFYNVVQPYSKVIHLAKNDRVYNFRKSSNKENGRYGIVYSMLHFIEDEQLKNVGGELGWCGLAWACRRSIFGEHGLYDRLVVGGGDRAFACACYGIKDVWPRDFLSEAANRDLRNWIDNIFFQVKGSVFYVGGRVFHLWHGNEGNRFYIIRHPKMAKFCFDPQKDIKINKEGCWEWSSNKPKLHKFVKDYFSARQEDGFRRLMLKPSLWFKEYVEVLYVHSFSEYKKGKKVKPFCCSLYGVLVAGNPLKKHFLSLSLKIFFGENLFSLLANFYRNVRKKQKASSSGLSKTKQKHR